jgi:lysophospholipase L1-like esterase
MDDTNPDVTTPDIAGPEGGSGPRGRDGSPGRASRLSLRKKLAFSLITCTAFFSLFEVGLRAANGWRSWLDCHRGHPVLGWCLREGWSGEQSWTGGFSRINPQGIRDDRPVGPKAVGEGRLLIIGDSITFGAAVRTDQAYPYRLERALEEAGRPWRVLNGGVTSYDSSQEADWLELFGWRLEPDVVAVAFCRNDLNASDRASSPKRQASGAVLCWLTEHSIAVTCLERIGWFLLAKASASYARGTKSSLESIAASYRRIASAAGARGVPVILFDFPTADLLSGRTRDDLSAWLLALGAELGWPVVDLAGAFGDDPDALFRPGDPVHPNAEGYRRVALYLARELVRRGLLPDYRGSESHGADTSKLLPVDTFGTRGTLSGTG